MTETPPIRVLVVDDSAFARKVVRECLTVGGMDVVGVARDGLEALEKIDELSPDVITLDLVMGNLDGLGVLKALRGKSRPKVVVVSMSDEDSALGLAALHDGAFDLVHKPTALAISQLYEIGDRLVAVVKAAVAAKPRVAAPVAASGPSHVASPVTHELVVVGASTGGPQALARLAADLPSTFPVPVAIVLHIPPGYTAAFAQRLDDLCALDVVEATDGLALTPGRVVVARAGRHLKLAREGGVLTCKLDLYPLEAAHRPAVDVLFEQAAAQVGRAALGVVLTGMGDDGLAGSRAVRAAGGAIITEAESSCVVYGMPRVVDEAGLSQAHAPIEHMVDAITRLL